MLTPHIIRRLSISRYLFHLALDNGRAARQVTAHACINILQDAIEIFFIAAAEHLNLPVNNQTTFNQYLDKTAEATGREVPYRQKLIEINRVRVNSKHAGILPDKSELSSYLLTARQFFEEASVLFFAQDFWTVSLIDLLDEGEAANLLREAERQFEKKDYVDCLINCRRAFFVTFEESYNIQRFETANPNDFFEHWGCDAPDYARSEQYIKQSVSDPFDYVVRDHGKIDAYLTKEGIDHTTFWNVWRLTPEVYRKSKDHQWITKIEPRKISHPDLKDTAAYVLDATISMILQLVINRRHWRSAQDAKLELTLRAARIPVYAKADTSSQVSKFIEQSDTVTVLGGFKTPGLKENKMFWQISAFNEKTKFFAYGYILESDVLTKP